MDAPMRVVGAGYLEDVPDFSSPLAPPIRFRIDDDEFYAVAEPPGYALLDMAGLQGALTENRVEALGRAMGFLDAVLLPDSAARFAARLRDSVQPITLQQAGAVIQYLVGRYSGRPTEPSLPSSNGQDGSGPTLTATSPSQA